MTVTVLTKDSLREFKYEILEAIKGMLEKKDEKPKKWLRASELKELLDISPGTLKTLRDSGTLIYYADYGPILYDYEHLLKLLEGSDELLSERSRERRK